MSAPTWRALLKDITSGLVCEPVFNAAGEVVAVARMSPELPVEARAVLFRDAVSAQCRFAEEVARNPESWVLRVESRRRTAEVLGRAGGEGR